MGKGIVGLDQAYQAVFVAALIFLAVMLILCRGSRIASFQST